MRDNRSLVLLYAEAENLLECLKALRERCDYSDLRAWADKVIDRAEGKSIPFGPEAVNRG